MPTLPELLSNGGPVLWLLLLVSAVAVAVFIERFLHCHRAQINSTEFLNGVRTVLKRNNVVEALSICDATPGPVARLVKTAILNRDHGRERVREALEEAGSAEVPRLEEKLNLLATIAQLAPLLGLLGTVLGFIQTFGRMQEAGLNAPYRPAFRRGLAGPGLRRGGIGRGDPRARRLQLPGQPRQFHRARYGTRRHRDRANRHGRRQIAAGTMKFPRNARIFRGQLDAAPFAAVFFLLVIFMMLGVPGLYSGSAPSSCSFPAPMGCRARRSQRFRWPLMPTGGCITKTSGLRKTTCWRRLREAVKKSPEPLTLVVQADKSVSYETCLRLALLARDAGISEALLATLPRAYAVPASRSRP